MIQLPNEVKIVKTDGNSSIFEISPLYPGYGVTIGNVLRRVLISSIEGAAITSVKIKNVDHEFSAIPGILEDVIQIIINLKKIRFDLQSEGPVNLSIYSKGKGAVTAQDIKTNSEVKVVNKDQHIATIADAKTEFEMEIRVEKGVGYVPVELRHKEKLNVGEIAIDGIFTPIRNVNFTVENIRIGQRTDFNKILLTIETDGSMTPEDALKRANTILLEHVNVFLGNRQVETESDDAREPQKEEPSSKVKKAKKKSAK